MRMPHQVQKIVLHSQLPCACIITSEIRTQHMSSLERFHCAWVLVFLIPLSVFCLPLPLPPVPVAAASTL